MPAVALGAALALGSQAALLQSTFQRARHAQDCRGLRRFPEVPATTAKQFPFQPPGPRLSDQWPSAPTRPQPHPLQITQCQRHSTKREPRKSAQTIQYSNFLSGRFYRFCLHFRLAHRSRHTIFMLRARSTDGRTRAPRPTVRHAFRAAHNIAEKTYVHMFLQRV